MNRYPFSQGAMLRVMPTDPITRNGVCVGVCDYWLQSMRQAPDADPVARLKQLAQQFGSIVNHHRQYARMRSTTDRNDARRQAGQQLGLDYFDQTIIMHGPSFNSMAKIRERLANDIRAPGNAATWTLVFQSGDRHAIAGFCGIAGTAPIFKHRIHIFDPNEGEFVCTRAEIDQVINQVLVNYTSPIVEVCRTTEGELA